MIEKWTVRFFGSALFLGYVPGMPGTVGSAAGAGLAWVLLHRLSLGWQQYLLACAACAVVGFLFAARAEKAFGRTDPPSFVLDEVVGQMLVFLLVPLGIKTMVMGFLYFRFFDIIKPYPVGDVDQVEGGAGIMLDDMVAGLMACVTLHVTLISYHVIMGYLAR